MDQMPSFGYWLRRRRKALDLTQAELAQRVGCVVTTIKKLEADERRPSKQLAERLADHLGIVAAERAAFLQAARFELAADRLVVANQPLTPPTETMPSQPPSFLPTGTLTFLFTDIVASSRHWEQQTEAMASALARHYVLLREAIDAHGGSVVKSTGDGVLAVFASAANALAAALAVQRALAAEPWGQTGPIHVRIALHSGAAELREGDYYGPTLNRAARLVAAGHGGQVLLSRATAELVQDRLPPDLQLRDLGPHQLKDLSRPEQIFQLVAPDLPSDFLPLRALEHRPQQLPAQSTALIGREQELARLCALLRRDDVRLLTLTGPGGIGKTRLGLQVAWELADLTTHSFWFVPLAAISEPELVVSAIAQTLGVREASGQPLAESLKAYLRDKQLVLLLDNFEQVVEAAPLVVELLAAAPKLKVLVTSRMRLNLTGEREFVVPPLSLPDPLRLPAYQDLSQYAAVRLFVERAQAAKDSFVLTEANAPAVAEICYRLDGLPLALELAAARIKLFPPQALLARLSTPLRLLTGGPRDLPARQQTLRNTIDWSYQLLGEGEQMLFARLAVFVGGCTLEAAEAVCNAEGDQPMDVMDGVAALVDKSMLRQEEGADGEPRVMMLETIREYALERLEQSGEAQTVRRRHAEYYLALAEYASRQINGPDQVVWLSRLEQEHDNMRAVLGRLHRSSDTEAGVRLVSTLADFWLTKGHWDEGLNAIETLLTQCRKLGASAHTAVLCRKAFDFVRIQGEYTQATALAEESLLLCQMLDDKIGVAQTLRKLARLASEQHDYGRAEKLAQESLLICRSVGNKWEIADSLDKLGRVALEQGNYQRAMALFEENQHLCQELNNRNGIALSLRFLGEVAWRQVDYQRATAFYEERLTLRRNMGDRAEIAFAISDLANLALDQGNNARATTLYEESLILCRELGDKDAIAKALNGLGEVARSDGKYRRAAAYYEESLALTRELGNRWLIATVLHNMGHIAIGQGDQTRASACFVESLTLYQKLGHKRGIVYCLAGLASVAQAQGQSERSARLFGAAEGLLHAVGGRWDPVDRAAYDRNLATTRAQLDEATFAAAWEAGRAMPLDQAIAEALEPLKEGPQGRSHPDLPSA